MDVWRSVWRCGGLSGGAEVFLEVCMEVSGCAERSIWRCGGLSGGVEVWLEMWSPSRTGYNLLWHLRSCNLGSPCANSYEGLIHCPVPIGGSLVLLRLGMKRRKSKGQAIR
ncbi:unnamed protein product [Boreogadus saida]